MKRKKETGGKRLTPRRYDPRVWLISLFLGPLAILLGVQTITLGSLTKALAWMGSHLAAAGLTYLFLLSAMVILTALTWREWAALLLLAVPVVTLAVVNRLKENVNGVPVVLSDFAMAAHAGTLMQFMSPELKVGVGVWVGLVLAVLAVLVTVWLGWRPKELTPRWKLRRYVLCLGVGLMAAVLLLPFKYYIGPGGEVQEERNQRLGLLGGLHSAVLSRATQRVEPYDPDTLREILDKVVETAAPAPTEVPTPEPTAEPVVPHVILMMSESFCDPTVVLPGVSCAADPIPNYHALAEQWPSGGFLSNTYAGGTGEVEMEVFTGIPTAFLREGESPTTLSGEGVYDRLPSVVKAFSAAGYATEFIHNYTPKLYDRAEQLPAIGFQKLTFEEDFPADAPRDGPYLSDMALAEEMIRAFEDRDPDRPLFLYGLTMGNHQPYYGDKFSTASGLEPECEGLSEEALGAVDALVHGLHTADAALGALIDYFSDCGEPVLVVFWGDHLPGTPVDGEDTLYSLLNYVPTADTLEWDSDTMKKMHTTPFVVWNNYGGTPDVPETLSVGSLGTELLGWAGVEKPLYFRMVDETLSTMLLYRSRLYVSGDGTPYREPPAEDAEAVERYRSVVYDLLYGDGTVSEAMTAVESEPPA